MSVWSGRWPLGEWAAQYNTEITSKLVFVALNLLRLWRWVVHWLFISRCISAVLLLEKGLSD